MMQERFMGLIRHVLGVAGTYLAYVGIVPEGKVEEIVGALMVVAAGVWSWVAKKDA